MKAAVNLLWILLATLGAVALAHVTGAMNPHEKVNGLWLVVATGCWPYSSLLWLVNELGALAI